MKPDKPTDRVRLEHIVQAIDLITSFTATLNLKKFLKDEKTISACLYQYAIIAEAIMHVDKKILDKYPYPWHKVKSFRNFILHEYHAIEMRVLWDTNIENLPELRKLVVEILQKEF